MESSSDAVAILILVAANGFSSDLAHCASVTRDPDFWSYLARAHIGPNKQSWLHAAAALGHTERVAFLCDVAGAPLEAVDSRRDSFNDWLGCGCRPLMWAAACNHDDAVTVLLQRGANINAGNFNGYTALHKAAMRGCVDTARVLLTNGADVDVCPMSYTPLAILMAYSGEVTMTPAVRCDYVACAALLIDAGASIHSRSKDALSCLDSACMGRNYKLVELLLARGADVNSVDSNGESALHVARTPEVATLLLNRGAHAVTATELTPLHCVALAAGDDEGASPDFLRGLADTCGVLLEGGVQVNARDANGHTALAYAEEATASELVAMLRKYGGTL